MSELTIVGRSSSHYTRVARLFAVELGVPFAFRPVLDLTSADPADYAGNPALKIPSLLIAGESGGEEGALFGCENICRELARRAGRRADVVLRGDVADRRVANLEELTLHVMATEVTLIMAQVTQSSAPPKVRRSLELTLGYLDRALEPALAALPATRVLSFVEAALFCTVTHLGFRQVAETAGYAQLTAFCARFGERPGARHTEYRFDKQ